VHTKVQTAERQELQRMINILLDESIIAILNLIRSLQPNTNDDGFGPHIPNAETAAAIREGRASNREKVTIDQIMAELNRV